jgi:hypothetical protein
MFEQPQDVFAPIDISALGVNFVDDFFGQRYRDANGTHMLM